ncbi:sigma-70 family RNA polymerase sigma factor [Spirosoma sp. HMF3257]|uniref:RNA polymerase sigma factor n=1 Tax=Spirosoma telluris TaxID=2183553 RepID=A0A327NPV2_9BACT|nr:sigma-70 family RNA polymerase sigma factor [Spirosoma telluris]RAI77451.1 RNA polymerase subunit sigma-70 [Spirosoma telluris]
MKQLPKQYTEQLLIQELKQGSKKAFSILYDQYSAALFGSITRICKNTDTAQDVLQETFIKIYQRIGLYDESKGRLFTWLLCIARHTALDELRKNNIGIVMEINTGNQHEIDREYQVNQPGIELLGILDLVNKLSPHKRQLIDLIYYKGYTLVEVAKKLNMPVGTVKTRVRATLQSLRCQECI